MNFNKISIASEDCSASSTIYMSLRVSRNGQP